MSSSAEPTRATSGLPALPQEISSPQIVTQLHRMLFLLLYEITTNGTWMVLTVCTLAVAVVLVLLLVKILSPKRRRSSSSLAFALNEVDSENRDDSRIEEKDRREVRNQHFSRIELESEAHDESNYLDAASAVKYNQLQRRYRRLITNPFRAISEPSLPVVGLSLIRKSFDDGDNYLPDGWESGRSTPSSSYSNGGSQYDSNHLQGRSVSSGVYTSIQEVADHQSVTGGKVYPHTHPPSPPVESPSQQSPGVFDYQSSRVYSRQQSPEVFDGHNHSPEVFDGHTHSPEVFDGHTHSPEVFDGHTHSPEVFDGHTHSPEVFDGHNHSPEVFDGLTHSPEVFDGHNHSPEVFDGHNHSPEVFDGHTHSPEVFDGHTHSPEVFGGHNHSPEVFDDRSQSPGVFDDRSQSPGVFDERTQSSDTFERLARSLDGSFRCLESPEVFYPRQGSGDSFEWRPASPDASGVRQASLDQNQGRSQTPDVSDSDQQRKNNSRKYDWSSEDVDKAVHSPDQESYPTDDQERLLQYFVSASRHEQLTDERSFTKNDQVKSRVSDLEFKTQHGATTPESDQEDEVVLSLENYDINKNNDDVEDFTDSVSPSHGPRSNLVDIITSLDEPDQGQGQKVGVKQVTFNVNTSEGRSPKRMVSDTEKGPTATDVQPQAVFARSLSRHQPGDALDEVEGVETVQTPNSFEMKFEPRELELQQLIEQSNNWTVALEPNRKDFKRQNAILELIATEKKYLGRLQLMQKHFAYHLLHSLHYSGDQVRRLFPQVDELVELHSRFLYQLLERQVKSEDKCVEEIGDILLDQFQGTTGEQMRTVYGIFCSRHAETIQLHKELLKTDKNFQEFAKHCYNLPASGKSELSDFILGVTVRFSKYPILIDSILTATTNKKDRELLSQALQCSKNVVGRVNRKISAYQKLVEIQRKMDSKSVTFNGRKFRRQDLSADNRELVHAGRMGWKSARGRVYDVLTVVLTDSVVFLQRSEQKYTFLMMDDKSCIVPLHNLVVREKADVKGSLGIYIISQRHPPEMYEMVCQSKAERKEWIRILQEAIDNCPPDRENQRRNLTRKAELNLPVRVPKLKTLDYVDKMKRLIEQLHQKDELIIKCCEDKNKLLAELLELNSTQGKTSMHFACKDVESLTKLVEIIQAAIQEASSLTHLLQASEVPLTRSTSAFGEATSQQLSSSFPRRSETFAGFDSPLKKNELHQKFANKRASSDEDGSAENLNMNLTDRDRSYSDSPDIILESQDEGRLQAWKNLGSTDLSSDQGSAEELTTPPTATLTQEQITSVCNVVQHLTDLVRLTSQQSTVVETLRAELAEAKGEIAKLTEDKTNLQAAFRSDGLEKFRNLSQEWERTKLYDRTNLDRQLSQLEIERREMDMEKMALSEQQEQLKRQKDHFQHQISSLSQRSYRMSDSPNQHPRDSIPEDRATPQRRHIPTPSFRPQLYYDTAEEGFDMVEIPLYTLPYPEQLIPQTDTLPDHPFNPMVFLEQPDFHLFNSSPEIINAGYDSSKHHTVESGLYGRPLRRYPSTAGYTSPWSSLEAPKLYPGPSGSPGVSRAKSMSASSRPIVAQQKNSQSAPSDLAKMIKFGKSSFVALSGNVSRNPSFSENSNPVAQSGNASGSSQRKEVTKRHTNIIYL